MSTSVLRLSDLDRWVDQQLGWAPARVWLLSGPIGAGKTTLVQHLARRLGVRSRVTSPTFSLQKMYPLAGQPWARLVHLDAYRLKSNHEIPALGLVELLADPSNFIVVEWPEKLPEVKWGPHARLTIAPGKNTQTRVLTTEICSG